MSEPSVRAPEVDPRRDYVSGVVLILLGTVAFSSAGFFVRLLAADAATLLFWRGLFTAATVAVYLVWRDGKAALVAGPRMGWPGLMVAILSAAAMGCFITSLQFTTVANNSIIFGTAPFMTAALAWVMIGERPSGATLAFSALAMLGAIVVVGSSIQVSVSSLIGDALALAMTAAFAIKTVLVRKHRALPMVHAGGLGALIGSAGAAPFVPSWSISAGDLAIYALFGLCQQGAGMILTTIGIGRVPAAHAALLMAFDLPMSPAWVWLVFGEQPSLLALTGGAIVLAAIIGHILLEGRRRRIDQS